MRRPMVAGNWKMNGSRAMAEALIHELRDGVSEHPDTDLLVCPPFVLLERCQNLLAGSTIALGAQNLDTHERGAYTGEIASDMLVETGCTYVIVGHSERRAMYGDTDKLVGLKAKVASVGGLTPIICLGETQEEREQDITADVVIRQLDAVLQEAGPSIFPDALIAYEPVWAIGTGLTASEEQAQEVHALIRGRLAAVSGSVAEATRILYGGSVKPDNAAGLFSQSDIDGGLIGGASLNGADFLGIISATAS